MRLSLATAMTAAALVSGALAAPAAAQDIVTVEKVDMVRYAGTWYEIARLPNKLQAECAGDVSTTFRLRGMRTYDIETRCRRKDGSEEIDMGIARVQDPTTGAKTSCAECFKFYSCPTVTTGGATEPAGGFSAS